jgi:hypothetical protein
MFGSQILDVALGLTFVFLLFSLILTAVRELIEAGLKTRAADLEQGIRELLGDPDGTGLAKRFYEHPLIYSLFKGAYVPGGFGRITGASTAARNLPSYIPSRTFAAVVLDLARDLAPPPVAAGGPPAAKTPSAQLGGAVRTITRLTGGDLNQTREEIEAWYDSAMDRVSGWYKRRTQILIFWTALGLAAAANVNALGIGEALARGPAVREAVVAEIESARLSASMSPEELEARLDRLNALSLPIGWSESARSYVEGRLTCRTGDVPCPAQILAGGVEVGLGWLLTALAISLGAPFWFDVLNKIMVIRSTVKPREKSQEEGSEDRVAGARAGRPSAGPGTAAADQTTPRSGPYDTAAAAPDPAPAPYVYG